MSVRSVAAKGAFLAVGVGAYVGAGYVGESAGSALGEGGANVGQNLRACADLAEYNPQAADLIFTPAEDGSTQLAIGIDIHESAAAYESGCDPYSFANDVQELDDEHRVSSGMIAFAAEHVMQESRDTETDTKNELQNLVLYGFGGVAAVWALAKVVARSKQAAANHRENKATKREEREARREARATRGAISRPAAAATVADDVTRELPITPGPTERYEIPADEDDLFGF